MLETQTATEDHSIPITDDENRDDVCQALVDQGYKRIDARTAAESAAGHTFSEMFKSALEWISRSRSGGRPIPNRSTAMQTQIEKTNGHAVAAAMDQEEKHCRGYKRECGEILGRLNRTGLCTTCYARKKYQEKYSPKAMRSATSPAKKTRRASKQSNLVEILDAPRTSERVTLSVTEEQLNSFLIKLPLPEKQRLANVYLQTAEI